MISGKELQIVFFRTTAMERKILQSGRGLPVNIAWINGKLQLRNRLENQLYGSRPCCRMGVHLILVKIKYADWVKAVLAQVLQLGSG